MGRINKTLATYERVAVEKQEGQISEAVNSLVRQKELRRVATSAHSLVAGAGILLTTLGVGASITLHQQKPALLVLPALVLPFL